MARITIEDCLKVGYNKYSLVHLATKRVLEFRRGKQKLVKSSNKEIVTALREIAAKKIIGVQKKSDYFRETLFETNEKSEEENSEVIS